MNFISKLIFVFLIFFTFDLSAETKRVSNSESIIILHDGMFKDGLPNKFELDSSKKTGRWGWGNWSSSQGYANFSFSQTGPGRILTETGMVSKKILKNWGVEDYNLGKKKGFKSSGKRAFVQLVKINNKNCVVVISRFGPSGTDAKSRMRSTVDGYICKNSGEITIDEGKNFMHCVELKNQGSHFIGRNIDNKCIKKEQVKKTIKTSDDQKKYLYCQDNEGVYEYLTGRDNCYDGQKKIHKSKYLKLKKESENNQNKETFEERLKKLKSLFEKELITKEEYDEKRKQILDQM